MSGVVGVHGSELGEGQEQPGNVVLGAIVNEVEVLRVDGHALQDGRHSADNDESNVVAGEDFNQPEESVLQLASHFRQADASPRVPASTRAGCRGGRHARDFDPRRCGRTLCSVEPRLRGLRTRLTPYQIWATKQHPDFARAGSWLGRSSRQLSLPGLSSSVASCAGWPSAERRDNAKHAARARKRCPLDQFVAAVGAFVGPVAHEAGGDPAPPTLHAGRDRTGLTALAPTSEQTSALQLALSRHSCLA